MAYLAGDQVRAGGDGVKRCTTHHLLTNGGKTGHPPGLLQDDCRKLSKWLASRMNALQEVREVCRLIAQEQTMNDRTEQTVTVVLPCPFCGSTEGFYVEEGSTFRWRVISCRNCGEGTEVRHKNNSDEPDSYIADWNAAAPYPAMLRKEIDNLRAQLAKLNAENEQLREQRNRIGLCIGHALSGGRKDDHEAGLVEW